MAEEEVVQWAQNQRVAMPGEPVCVVCGRYGAYVCDATEADVCSLECKAVYLNFLGYASMPPIPIAPSVSSMEEQAHRFRQELSIRVKGDCVPLLKHSFTQLELPRPLDDNLQAAGYDTPTPVQMQVVPAAMAGRDVLACAQTGSGKTASFLLPLIVHVHRTRSAVPEGQSLGLILAPTRELCMQIEEQTKELARDMSMRTALVVIVATPGRLIDVLSRRGDLFLASISFLVLDEADMMLSMGFGPQVSQIVEALPSQPRQTLMLSATIPNAIEKLASTLLTNPVYVSVGKVGLPSEAVKQNVVWVEEKDKKHKLFNLLSDSRHFHPPLVVFVGSKVGSDLLADAIRKKFGWDVQAIHGDKSQQERTEVLNAFLEGASPVIVATSVLGRGLDLINVTQVVHFDMPPSVQEYIHQIGRAGRLGERGWALSFINKNDKHLFGEFSLLLKKSGAYIPPELLRTTQAQTALNQRQHADDEKKRSGNQDAGLDKKDKRRRKR